MNLIVNGALGRMGQEVCRLAQAEGHTLAARVGRSAPTGASPTWPTIPARRMRSSTFPTTPACLN